MRAGSNQPVHEGDVVIFDKVKTATQSVDEATVKGRAGGTIANVGMPLPGLWSPPFQPGPTPITLSWLAPMAIPIAYSALDSYLKSPTAVEDIAQLLERFGVDSELLRGPAYQNTDDYDVPKGFTETKEFGRMHGQKVYQKSERYISRDIGQKDGSSHNGGIWKEFRKVGNRLQRVGTLDRNMKWIKD